MEKKEAMLVHISKKPEEMEGVRRTTGISSGSRTEGREGLSVVPDPEVPEKAIRRRYTAEYKRRILREAEACSERGKLGALLRREGLYSSNLINWRRQAEKASLEALSPKKRVQRKRNPILPLCGWPNWRRQTKSGTINSDRQN